MALTQRLDVRQAQGLVMTPQLQQAIKLLQLNNQELAAYVDGEVEQNPFLDKDEGDGSAMAEALPSESPAREEETAPETWDGAGFERDTFDETSAVTVPASNDDPGDVDYDNQWSSASTSDSGGELANWRERAGGFDDGSLTLDQTLAAGVSLRDHLLNQLTLETAEPGQRLIGLHLIEMIDDAGYLSGELNDVADHLGCSRQEVDAVLAQVQRFDPPGIMARSLAECLANQLRDRNRFDPAMAALLDNLDLLAKRDLAGLRRLCGVDQEELTEMIVEIRTLDPKPGESFLPAGDDAVSPDVLMHARPDGTWQIELNTDNLPRVLVNNAYLAQVSRRGASKEDRSYINQCQQSANWLVKALHQRATTILKVSTEIVRQQEGFFLYGVRYLKPLVLRDIAEAIEMHESTVSRVTSNKFIATPRGMFELKYFFTAAIASAEGGGAISAEAVRTRIKSLIDAESPKKNPFRRQIGRNVAKRRNRYRPPNRR